MRKIDLISMRVANFKGVRDFSVDLHGRDAVISGANATGKTTVYDAFLWSLFGKDSSGAADFDFKPLDADGNEIHNLDTCVEVVLRIDGTEHTLRRLSAEKWSRPRGQIEHVYGGNTTSYWVDDVPRTMAEYKAYVDGLVAEDVFRLITNHAAFNALKMADRRKALIAISGVDVEDKLAAQFPDAAGVLGSNSPEDARKRLREQRKRLNAELDAIPARIDELTKLAGETDERVKRDAEHAIADYTNSLARVDDLIAQHRASDPAEAARARLSAMERELAAMEREAEQRRLSAVRDAQSALRDATRDWDHAAERRTDLDKRIAAAEVEIAERAKNIDWMRDEWRRAAEAQYQPSDLADVCPACGQALPADQIAAAREADRRLFDGAKRKRLDQIEAQAKRIKASLADDQARAEKMRGELVEWAIRETAAAHAVAVAQTALDAVPEAKLPPEHAALAAEAAALRAAEPGDDKTLRDLQERRAELATKIERHRTTLAAIQAAEAARKRVDDLAVEQRALGDKVAAIDQQMIMLERYVSARCRLLEDGINEMFPTVRWRLFNRLDNGGIEDACDCLIPTPTGAMAAYGRSANTGARINAGLEIINVLCGFYQVAAPIFVDGAESVNQLARTVGQQIRLVVTDDAALRVEVAA